MKNTAHYIVYMQWQKKEGKNIYKAGTFVGLLMNQLIFTLLIKTSWV